MKISIDIDCSPQEARAFFGLPNVEPIQEAGMTYGVQVDVMAPVEMYDALHAEVVRSTEALVEGLLLHIGRRTAEGFRVVARPMWIAGTRENRRLRLWNEHGWLLAEFQPSGR